MRRFYIDFQWLNRDYGDAVDRATLAEITVTVTGQGATELEDLVSKTVRPGVRASAFALAQWLVANWWRLLWEPERNTLAWRMSHMVGAVGGGYLWPDLTFAGDGGFILIRSRPTSPGPESTVRYLNGFDVSLPVSEFEEGMESFVLGVVGRLIDSRVSAEGFESLWKEVNTERYDPALAAWRKLEALMGYDPDDVAPEMIAALHRAAGVNMERAPSKRWRLSSWVTLSRTSMRFGATCERGPFRSPSPISMICANGSKR